MTAIGKPAAAPPGGPLVHLWRLVTGTAAGAARLAHGWSAALGQHERARDLAERLALAPTLADLPRGAVWLHGASVGEVRALAPLARALAAARPDLPQVVTATTTAGRARAAAESGAAARLAPLDGAGPLRRFAAAVRPRLHVMVETELWPLRLLHLRRGGVPAALVSARLSPERLPTYVRLRGLYGPCIEGLALLAPASEADRARFAALGADPARFGPSENLKWDAAPAPLDAAAAEELRARLGLDPALPWIVLGSVHPGEALALLLALQAALGDRPLPGVLLAPRHPDRFADELRRVEERFGPAARASAGPAPPGTRRLVLDTIGTLPRVYALARAGTLGGSFVPVGGHTPLEAAASGCPLVAGPHTAHQADLLEPLLACGSVVPAADPAEAAARLARWLEDPAEAREAGAAGRAEVDRRRGVAPRLAARLSALVPAGSGPVTRAPGGAGR